MIIAPAQHFFAWLNRGSGLVTGYASPEAGYAPCLIHVRSGNRVLAAVEATAYAGDDCDYRLGWCGFNIRLDAHMFLFSDEIELACGSSGRSLLNLVFEQVSPDFLIQFEAASRPTMVERLMREDLAPISASGVARLIHAVAVENAAELATHVLYQLVLGRAADYEGLRTTIPHMGSFESIHLRIINMLGSEEFANLPVERHFRTPYQDRIPYEILIAIARPRANLAAALGRASKSKLEPSFIQKEAVEGYDMEEFNAAWYAHYYRDVGPSGMDPADHFEWIGRRLNRAPNANALSGRGR